MQITIPQSEIETAIIDYIQSRVQISEGMQIEIDLRATRGAEGFQAIIDIFPEGQSRPKPSAAGAKEKTKAPPAAKTKTASAPKKVVSKVLTPPANFIPDEMITEAESVEEALTPVKEPEVVATEIAQSVDDEAEAEPAKAEEPAAEVEDAPKAPSIFANAQAKKEEAAAAEAPAPAAKSIFGSLRRPINES